jgi:hypothetical protein
MSDLDEVVGDGQEMTEVDPQFTVGEYDIEVVDEREPEDQREPEVETPVADLDPDGEPTDEELKAVSARVKKRIDKLTFKINDERRGREAAERMQEEAIRFAQQQQGENTQLRTLMQEGETFLVSEVRNRTKTEVTSAHQELQQAMNEGDPIKIADAQMRLNRAQIEQHQAETYTPQIAPQQGQTPTQTTQPMPQAAPPPQPPKAEPDFVDWQNRNPWFNVDMEKRKHAIALHEDIKARQESTGVFVGTDEYYTQIDSKMKEAFPSFFGVEGTSEPAANPAPPVVAPTSRQPADSGGSPRKVQLTETQVSLAKRLKIPLEVYAREHLKLGSS